MNPTYSYFVSYSHVNSNGSGFGCTQINLTKPIRSFDDVMLVRKAIAESLPGFDVVVINFRRFDSVDDGSL